MMFCLALALAAMSGLGSVENASARDARPRDLVGTWRLETRSDMDGYGRNGGGWGRNDPNFGNDRWQHNGRGNSNGGGWNNSRFGDRFAYLPELIQIDRNLRVLQVENDRGMTLRTADLRRNNGVVRFVTNGPRGSTITETMSLERGGSRLVVRTSVSGRGDTQDFTSIYQRA